MMESNAGAQAPVGTAVKPAEPDRPRPSDRRPHGILSLLVLVRDTVFVIFDALRGRYDG
jgi:hypothetical protein